MAVWIRESKPNDQLCYQILGFELVHPKICIICERVSPADPKLQDLHDTGQKEDNQEESW